VPVEDRARIICQASPHFADVVAGLYARLSGRGTVAQLQATLQRKVCLQTVQRIADACGKVALAQERGHPYAIQAAPQEVAAVVVMADATTALIVDEGYKHVALGGFFFLDAQGNRLEKDSIFLANAPEEGKVTFWRRMEQEFERIKARFPDALYVGLCDGAEEMQNWLEARCEVVGLDFYHATEYISAVKPVLGGPDELGGGGDAVAVGVGEWRCCSG
jgi:hypothetical protein